jgi:hypothetical protein
MTTLTHLETKRISSVLAGAAAVWLIAVCAGASTGFFSALYQPAIALIVAATIALPAGWYFSSIRLRQYVAQLGHRPLVAMHIWRVPAAMMFFWLGANGELPPVFWIVAGVGDFAAGSYAAYLMFRPLTRQRVFSFHVFGFADFVVAVGIGLTYTLLQDPRMAPVTTLPFALIPLFGVGISGAVHLIAFDLLRRDHGMPSRDIARE